MENMEESNTDDAADCPFPAPMADDSCHDGPATCNETSAVKPTAESKRLWSGLCSAGLQSNCLTLLVYKSTMSSSYFYNRGEMWRMR